MKIKIIHIGSFLIFILILIVPITHSIGNTKLSSFQSVPYTSVRLNNSVFNLIENNIEITTPHQEVNSNENIISMIEQLDEIMVLEYIENLTSFGPRVTSTTACFDAGKYIYNEFEEMGLEVRYQNWSSHSYDGSNIEATLYGLNSSSDEIYIICGHYDSVSSSPGADDNGAGTTAVLSAAYILSQYQFNHTIKFVTFSGEEQGLYGSKAYAEEAVQHNDNIIVAINMDMMGYADENDDKVKVYYADSFEWIMDLTMDVNQQYMQYIDMLAIPSGTTGRSDHVSFWNNGYNAIFFFEYDVNPYYHTHGDTIEHMSIPYATHVSKLSLAVLATLSEQTSNTPPKIPESPSGPTNGKSNTKYTYSTRSTDAHSQEIYYLWDWGDGTNTEWIGPYASSALCESSHNWTEKGEYQIRVKARDATGYESDWSESLSITMPKQGNLFHISFLFKRLLNNILS